VTTEHSRGRGIEVNTEALIKQRNSVNQEANTAMITLKTLTPSSPQDKAVFAPLREVGTTEKTQFWDMDEIMEALRIANREGISLNALRARGNASDPAAA
jgi:hypothetical protein